MLVTRQGPGAGTNQGPTPIPKEDLPVRLARLIHTFMLLVAAALAGAGSAAAADSLPAAYHLRVFASGGPSLTSPDDITQLDGQIYVAYQNGTQPDGSGGTSTIVGYRPDGKQTGSWDVSGHCDGLTADPRDQRLIVTVNEDANSSLYTIDPHAPAGLELRHYSYSPDPATLSGGGTDAITIIDGRILISASNPSPSTPGGSTYTGAAVYTATIPEHGSVVSLSPTFYDNSGATDAVTRQSVTLNLSDPDSNAAVPSTSTRFAGDFMLDSQGDSELVFAADPGALDQTLTRLMLTSDAGAPQVDDVRWTTTPHGTLFVVDGSQDQIDAISGPFDSGIALTAIPDDSPALPGEIGTVDLTTGLVETFATGLGSPKGLLYLPGHDRDGSGHRGEPSRHRHSSKRSR
jgi:hypothetical protein